jgi:hypothetical protein
MDKNKGFLGDALEGSLERAGQLAAHPEFDDFSTAEHFKKALSNGHEKNRWPRLPGSSDTGDPYGHLLKPVTTTKWTSPPFSDKEKALYYGVHLHSESNPLGLHTHNPGGSLSGGHSHGPQNRLGVHHHKSEDVTYGANLDGKHTHEGKNFPDGGHDHIPENFG